MAAALFGCVETVSQVSGCGGGGDGGGILSAGGGGGGGG